MRVRLPFSLAAAGAIFASSVPNFLCFSVRRQPVVSSFISKKSSLPLYNKTSCVDGITVRDGIQDGAVFKVNGSVTPKDNVTIQMSLKGTEVYSIVVSPQEDNITLTSDNVKQTPLNEITESFTVVIRKDKDQYTVYGMSPFSGRMTEIVLDGKALVDQISVKGASGKVYVSSQSVSSFICESPSNPITIYISENKTEPKGSHISLSDKDAGNIWVPHLQFEANAVPFTGSATYCAGNFKERYYIMQRENCNQHGWNHLFTFYVSNKEGPGLQLLTLGFRPNPYRVRVTLGDKPVPEYEPRYKIYTPSVKVR